MKAFIKRITNTEALVSPLILRIALFIVLWPHGAQLLLGWFGGYGFTGSMGYFTQGAGLPYIVGFLVIFLLFFGSISILAGLFVRLFAIALLIMFIGMISTVHLQFGFFMNWFGSQKGEGIEYHLLLMGIAIALIVTGGGKGSTDILISSK